MRAYMQFLGLTGLVAASAVTAGHAASFQIENARVRLPEGQIITVNQNTYPWWKDPRVINYHRYVYNPQERLYYVYRNDEDYYRRMHRRYNTHREHHWCPPGLARQGRC